MSGRPGVETGLEFEKLQYLLPDPDDDGKGEGRETVADRSGTSADEDANRWIVKANNIQYSIDRNYATNVISTSKYTLLTFLPVNLFVQFKRVANAYFLILLILQLIPQISSLSPITTAIPLIAVLAFTAAKDAYDDIKRHQSDAGVNNRKTFVVSGDRAVKRIGSTFISSMRWGNFNDDNDEKVSRSSAGIPWKDVRVGSIIRLKNNDFIAADMLLLSTSDSNGLCYVETAELDGETNLKVRQTLDDINILDEVDLCKFNGTIVCESPNNVLDKYEGKLVWRDQTYGLDNSNLLLRGCKLRNTEWAYGVVVFAGHETKLMQNSGETKLKRTRLDHVMNTLLICIFCFLIALSIIGAVLNSVYEHTVLSDLLVYIPYIESEPKSADGIAALQFFSYIILLNTLVPISLYVSVEFIRLGQSFLINWDRGMYYEQYDQPARARTSTLNEELGQIEYIFSDKTGTLTQNIMTFLKCTVGGRVYGHWGSLDSGQDDEDGATKHPGVLKVSADDADEAVAESVLGTSQPATDTKRSTSSTPPGEHLSYTMQVCGEGSAVATANTGCESTLGSKELLPNAIETPSTDGMPPEPDSLRMTSAARDEDDGCGMSGMRDVGVMIKPSQPIAFANETPFGEESFVHYDHDLLAAAKDKSSSVFNFFHCLSVCHSVVTETEADKLTYQAQSPDEAALVSASRNFGLAFLERTPSSVTVDEHGQRVTYEVLCILDFNNVRKRMSVIVRVPGGGVRLICKGADNVIFARLSPSCKTLADETQAHLNVFAQDGLRTLCIAYRDLSEAEWKEWHVKHHAANTALEDRDDKLSEVYEQVEKDMLLVGASAIEDKLQDGVPNTIATLARANIKIWVLTGDKDETAINIGYSSKLLTADMQVFLVDGRTEEEVCGSLTKIKRKIDEARADFEREHGVSLDKEDPFEDPAEAERKPKFGIVINGYSLAPALGPTLKLLLLNTAVLCRAVICCRVTPLQKAKVVSLVKQNRKAVTLAIGDGANDVGMIKTAHIGVGISGQEGMQAVLASDYSFAQFRYLERLLLVHGRWSYMRMCKFLGYFFYKNFAFVLVQFWFAFYCGFTAQAYFDPWFITVYNVIFTSLPVLIVGIFDQDVNDKLCLRHPRLYIPGQQNLLFNKKTFAWGIFKGVVVSLVIYFGIHFAFAEAVDHIGLDLASNFAVGAVGACALVVIVNLQLGLDTYHWTALNHFAIWGSIAMWFVFALIVYSGPIYSVSAAFLNDPGVAIHLFTSAPFWLVIPLLVAVALLPVLAHRFIETTVHPLLVDTIRRDREAFELEAMEAEKKVAEPPPALEESTETPKERSVSVRSRARSAASKWQQSRAEAISFDSKGIRRELRSGYSFSYTPGFGDLITSGRVMGGTSKKSFTSSGVSGSAATAGNDPSPLTNVTDSSSCRTSLVEM